VFLLASSFSHALGAAGATRTRGQSRHLPIRIPRGVAAARSTTCGSSAAGPAPSSAAARQRPRRPAAHPAQLVQVYGRAARPSPLAAAAAQGDPPRPLTVKSWVSRSSTAAVCSSTKDSGVVGELVLELAQAPLVQVAVAGVVGAALGVVEVGDYRHPQDGGSDRGPGPPARRGAARICRSRRRAGCGCRWCGRPDPARPPRERGRAGGRDRSGRLGRPAGRSRAAEAVVRAGPLRGNQAPPISPNCCSGAAARSSPARPNA
jgi:hypothetical protein